MTHYVTDDDENNERLIACMVERAFGCDVCKYPRFSPIDWYAARDGRLVAVLELKARTHATTTYPTVFLSVRKWLALGLAELGLDVPAFYVVQFTDGVRLCRVRDVAAGWPC